MKNAKLKLFLLITLTACAVLLTSCFLQALILNTIKTAISNTISFFMNIASQTYTFQKYLNYFPNYLPISPLLFLFFLL